MPRLSIFCGIGLMLASALAYQFSPVYSYSTLLPAFGGIAMALAGVAARFSPPSQNYLMYISTAIASVELFGSAFVLPIDVISSDYSAVVSTLGVVFICSIFIHNQIRSYIEEALKRQFAAQADMFNKIAASKKE